MLHLKLKYLCTATLILTHTAFSPLCAEPVHGVAMYGQPELGENYQNFPYANPTAPKGGAITYGWEGTFNSLNPFIVQGDAPRGLFEAEFGYNVFESLLARSRDEPFTLYSLIAQKVEMDDERSFIEFTLDPKAKFSNGEPITVDDVIFSMKLLGEKARPLYRRWIGLVDKMEKTGKNKVRFTMKPEADRELPLLLATLPILPKHATDFENFDKTTIKPLVASGPYIIKEAKIGSYVTLQRNPDYWAKDHPSKRGFDNYDEIKILYFRDESAIFEAMKKGVVSIFVETNPSRWADEYNFPAINDGTIHKSTFTHQLPSGMKGFVFNTRREKLANREFRRALADLLDFEWINNNLFNGAYLRTKSFFDGSILSSNGRPMDAHEKEILAPFMDVVAPEARDGTLAPSSSDGTGRDRKFMRNAFDRLKKAGYALKDRKLFDPDGNRVSLEILLKGKSGEAIASAWKRNLNQMGIEVTLRPVDDAQYQQRVQTYDYDIILPSYPSSLSPGAEQIGRWGSASSKAEGTYNFAGASEPAIDAAIQAMLNARSKEDFISAVRAYDRVLLSGFYIVPLYHSKEKFIAHSSAIHAPEKTPIYGPQLQTWWMEQK